MLPFRACLHDDALMAGQHSDKILDKAVLVFYEKKTPL